MNVEGMYVVVLGLARSGEAAARALVSRGAKVRVLDAADGPAQQERVERLEGAECILGRYEPGDVTGADLVIASPAVRPDSLWITAASSTDVPVWSEIELAYRLGVHPVAAITGTNGKTTTTEMLAAAIGAIAAGNVGTPLCSVEPGTTVVAEVSSFQLWGIESFTAPVAVVLNVAPDHLDWHASFDDYAATKARITENQSATDALIHGADLAFTTRARSIPFDVGSLPVDGAGVSDGWIVVPQGRVVEVARLRAKGRPNLADAVAAAAAACALGHDPADVGASLASYVPRPHRLETIATIAGVTYINDSKATDPHATLAALAELGNVILIAGGQNKGLDLRALAEAAPALRAVIAIGDAAGEIAQAFAATGIAVEVSASMEDAVKRATAQARQGDTVLLSPACASFDMFTNYEARGDAFRAAVASLEGRGL